MARKRKPDPIASAFAKKRWEKATPAERQEVGRRLQSARWRGKTKAERRAHAMMMVAARRRRRLEREEGKNR